MTYLLRPQDARHAVPPAEEFIVGAKKSWDARLVSPAFPLVQLTGR
jgi:hypothetical protein